MTSGKSNGLVAFTADELSNVGPGGSQINED
jgi:hypothetical protein